MKILQLVTRRQYRGAEVFAANLSEELIKAGHSVIFTGLYTNRKNVLHVQHAQNLDLSTKKSSPFSPVLLKNLIRLVREIKPDIIQCNGSDTLKYMVVASFFLPKTPILYRNISMISKWMYGRHKKMLYNLIFRRISHVSSVGNEAIEDFITTFQFPREKTSVIRRGIPVKEVDEFEAREKLRLQLGLKKEDKIIMHIGNFSPEKNHSFLLDIFDNFKETYPNYKLVCIGNGILYEKVQSEVKKRQLNKTVFLMGFRKNIPGLLAAADCCVLSSFVEGVPGVILEAAIQKVPTVSTDVGGVKEVLVNDKTGFYIKNFDKKEFSQKLIKLISDDELRKVMGQNAYEFALEEFNTTKNAKKFESLYYELTQKQLMVH